MFIVSRSIYVLIDALYSVCYRDFNMPVAWVLLGPMKNNIARGYEYLIIKKKPVD